MKDWIDLHHLFIVQPRTPEDSEILADDIHTLASLQPQYDRNYIDIAIRHFPHAFTVIYHDDQAVAFIEINDNSTHDLGKDSLEFGGSVLPDYRHKGLTQQVAPAIIRSAFRRTGKKKMLAEIPVENAEARHAITALGFKFYGNEGDIARYKLDRKDVLG